MLLLGGDLHHRVQGLSGLNVGKAPPRGDLTQTVHVSGCNQQVAGKSRRGQRSERRLAISLPGFWVIQALTYLGNMWPVSFTSLHGMWCFTSGLFIQVWMLTISFLSSSDIDELSISSTREDNRQVVAALPTWNQARADEVYLYHTLLRQRCWTPASPRGTVYPHGHCCSRVCRQRAKGKS